jgi:hypothetical protein
LFQGKYPNGFKYVDDFHLLLMIGLIEFSVRMVFSVVTRAITFPIHSQASV